MILLNPPKFLTYYWLNSGLAVGLMLWFAFSNTANTIWKMFGTANQLLAALVLIIITCWLLERGRKSWFAFIPAVLMLLTTVTMPTADALLRLLMTPIR